MRVFQGQRQPVEAVAFAPDNRHLAATDGKGWSVHDVPTGKTLHRVSESYGRPQLLTFLPNGRLVMAASNRMHMYVDPLEDGGHVGFYPNEVKDPPHALFAAPDGKRLLAATQFAAHCWTTTQHVPQAGWATTRASVGLDVIVGAALSPTGDRLALTHTVDRGDILDTTTGRLLESSSRLGTVAARAWSPDGRFIAGLFKGGFRLLPLDPADAAVEVVSGGKRRITAVAFHPEGQLYVGHSDGTVCVYAPGSDREEKTFDWKVVKVHSVAVSPDGALAAVGGDKGQVVVWDI